MEAAFEGAPKPDVEAVTPAEEAGDAEWTLRTRIARHGLAEAENARERAPVPEPELDLGNEGSELLAAEPDAVKEMLLARTWIGPLAAGEAPDDLSPFTRLRLLPPAPPASAGVEETLDSDVPVGAVEAVARGPPAGSGLDVVEPALTRVPVIQTKLTVSVPGDPLEREADAVAARVLRGGGAPVPAHVGASPVGRLQRAVPPIRGPPASAADTRTLPRSVTTAVAARAAGSPLDAALRTRIEPQLGVDLGHVRVRSDAAAAAAAADLHARAFTAGSTIYLAAGSSPADLGLIAHEATHVVQQETVAAARTTVMRDATDLLPDISISDVIPDWILDGVRDTIRSIPGYVLLTYVTGRDPLSDEPAPATPAELIEKLLTFGPFGAAVGAVLQTMDVIGEIFAFVMEGLEAHGLTFARIERDVGAAWDEFSITNGIAGNAAIVRRYVDAFLRDILAFVQSIVDRVLEIVRSVVAEFAEPLLEADPIGPVWSLVKKVIHYDPLRGEAVDAPTVEIIADFLRLIGQEERLAQMEERGTLQETADWLDTQLIVFVGLVVDLGTLFADAWAAIQPENLANLFDNLGGLAQRAYGLVLRVADFATTVIVQVLELIKNALLEWLSEHAHTVPGFHLLTVILGVNPFTGEVVERTAENLIRGFITLLPGGEETYKQLAESGVIADAAARIEGAMSTLGISLDLVTGIFLGIWNTLTLDDLLDPIGAFIRVLNLFGEPLSRLIRFVGVVIEVVVTLVLHLMNFPSDLLASVISNALAAIHDIRRDPVGFLLNMMEALKAGFIGFFSNIAKYLLDGLVSWLFRGLGKLGITLPTDFTLGSILTLVFQVLGLSVEHLWEKLAEHIGPERVAMIRKAIAVLTGAWAFVQEVQRDGIAAIWRYVQDQLSSLWQTVLQTAMEWVMTQIITSGTIKLLSFLDPTFIMSVVNGCIALFNAVQAAIEYLRDMLEILNLYVGTLAQVAAGNIAPAAEKLEAGLAAVVPVAIGFLAYLLGIDDVPKRIADIIRGVRGAVDRAIDWLIKQALRLGAAALNALGLGGGGRGGSPEERKQAALDEVRAAMTRGIRRSALVALLADLKSRLELRRCELVDDSDVVIENSASVIVEGKLFFTQEEVKKATGVEHRLPGPKGGRNVEVGEFVSTGDVPDTVRGLLAPYEQGWLAESGLRVPWPTTFANMDPTAMRPHRVTARLKGVLDIPVTKVARDGIMTNRVGDMGDIEHAVRGNLKASSKNFVGGHVIAHELAGPETYENLVPMRTKLNDPLYKGVEQFVVNNLHNIRPGSPLAPEDLPLSATLTFEMQYPGPATAKIPQLAHMIATEIGPGRLPPPDTPERAETLAVMGDRRAALRASISGTPGTLTIPARIPTTLVLHGRFESAAPEGTVPGTRSRVGSSRTLEAVAVDPMITVAVGAAAPAGAGTTTLAVPVEPVAIGPWERTWTFTQST
jgi:hypothetical protein